MAPTRSGSTATEIRPGLANISTFLNCNVITFMRRPDGTNMHEGDDHWLGWSWFFPAGFPGTGSWGTILEHGPGHTQHFFSYRNISWDIQDANAMKLMFSTGHIPDPGTGDYNPTPPNGYKADEVLLGTGSPRPFTKGVWHDFYILCQYNARTNGIMEVWHRVEGATTFEKLYSNSNDGTALINRAPHPTWLYNSTYGYPGEPSGDEPPPFTPYRIYRGVSAYDLSVDVIYWADGFFSASRSRQF